MLRQETREGSCENDVVCVFLVAPSHPVPLLFSFLVGLVVRFPVFQTNNDEV